MAVPTVVAAGAAVEHASGAEQRYFDYTLPAGTQVGDLFVFNLTTSSTVTTEPGLPDGVDSRLAMSSIGVGVSGGVYIYKVPTGDGAGTLLRFDWGTPRRGSLMYVHLRGDDVNL